MKIVFFIDGLRRGGKERQLITLLKWLIIKKDFKIIVVVMNKNIHYKEIFDLNVDIHYFIRKSKRDFSVFYKFFMLCREIKPDIIHTWDSLTSIYSLPAHLLGIKIINGVRHAIRRQIFKKNWFISKLTFSFSKRVVYNSMAGLSANNLKLSKKNKCIVNGFDLTRISLLTSEEKIRKEFSIRTPFIVGIVANFGDAKDYNSFILAAESILAHREDVTFIAVGDGKNFNYIKNIIKKKHRDHIKLLGKQNNVESIINIFNIALLISNTIGHAEGISNSIMEYMVLGKPVIATDSGGNKELVIHNKTGYIIKAFDIKVLGQKIEYLLDNREIAKEMGVLGKQRIINEFSIRKMTDNYIQLYNELCK